MTHPGGGPQGTAVGEVVGAEVGTAVDVGAGAVVVCVGIGEETAVGVKSLAAIMKGPR